MTFMENITDGFLALFFVLRDNPSLWWLLTPVLILWTATEAYFAEYSRERFGFSSVFTGAVSLLWLSFITLQKIFQGPEGVKRGLILGTALALVFYALIIIYLSFSHMLSEKKLGVAASPRVIYFASIILVFFGVGEAGAKLEVVLALSAVFIAVSLAFSVIKKYFLAGFWGELEAVEKAGDRQKT